MKRKRLAELPARKIKKEGLCMTAAVEGSVLVLDIFEDGERSARYMLDSDGGEHCAYMDLTKLWHQWSLASAVGFDSVLYVSAYDLEKHIAFAEQKDRELAATILDVGIPEEFGIFEKILELEREYNQYLQDIRKEHYMQRLRTLVESVPEVPEDFDDWVRETIFPEEYALKGSKTGCAYCTACGEEIRRKDLKISGRMAKIGETADCPACGRKLVVKIRSEKMEREGMATLLQDIDEKKSIARHIDVKRVWKAGRRKVFRSESTWVFLLRQDRRRDIKLLYNQEPKADWRRYGCFNKSNPASRRCRAGYLYPMGIKETLTGTAFVREEKLLCQMAAAGSYVNYNRVMAGAGNKATLRLIEYLFKGRFKKLLQETAERISYYRGCYEWGPLDQRGETIEEVFGIRDRQRINRIRETDGGEECVRWMQLSDESGEKIPQDVLEWLIGNTVNVQNVKGLLQRMSPVKIKNYVVRQQAESYPGMSANSVLEQWLDYLDMCKKEKKDLSDEMILKPRELKRRHDEIAEEINRRRVMEELKRSRKQAQKRAEELRARFPGAEEVLKEVKGRFEYENENYILLVPERLVEITLEGAALHHCVGSTDRYFERIRNHETYICFLRKKEAPQTPYYTIEIEPGGTIRQHRGYLDEEPNIDEVKPFLKEYQRELRKRLTAEDRRHAESSAVLRRKNIEELKAKNNRRVLAGLMEDFMEAEALEAI